jgi:hypothetical protein
VTCMWCDDLPIEVIRLVTPRAVQAYAEGLGWQKVKVDGVNVKIAVYTNPNAPLRQLIVPLDEGLDDYPERIAEAVRRLAEFEKRPAFKVLNHLLFPPVDVCRWQELAQFDSSSELCPRCGCLLPRRLSGDTLTQSTGERHNEDDNFDR